MVVGNCGVGFAPVQPADHDRLIELMEGVEDIPGTALHEGLTWAWQTFAEFLDALDGRPYDIDVADPGAARRRPAHVMGERGAQRERPRPRRSPRWPRSPREGIEAGALGFTTSRTRNHRSSTGELTPTPHRRRRRAGRHRRGHRRTGTGVLQIVSDFIDVDAEFGLFRTMAEASGRPLSFSLAGVDPEQSAASWAARPGQRRRA